MTVVRQRGNTRTIIEATGNEVRWATQTWVPNVFLDQNAQRRAMAMRALSDSKGGWQRLADHIPLNQLYEWIPKPVDWQDWKYLCKKLNDPDYRKYRTDGDHRRA